MTASTEVWERREEVPESVRRRRRVLVSCGVLAALLYVGSDLLAGALWAGYSFTDQAISELSAIGAPTRELMVVLGFVYDVLFLAFGLGVWKSGPTRALRVTGGLLMGAGALGFVWAWFPIHLPGAEPTLGDLVHSVLAGVNVALFLLAVGFGAVGSAGRFRVFSIGTLVTLLGVGTASFVMAGSQVATQGVLAPPPSFGLIERVDGYACMLWVAVLAAVLLRTAEPPAAARLQIVRGAPDSVDAASDPRDRPADPSEGPVMDSRDVELSRWSADG